MTFSGIWTDGIWAFSTGLDQRIRCWKIGFCGKLTEHAHLVVSVPEPEALAAINYDRWAFFGTRYCFFLAFSLLTIAIVYYV